MCTKLTASQRNWIFYGFCSIPLILGICSVCLGIWLCVVVLHNAGESPDKQIYFEKVITTNIQEGSDWDSSAHLGNESPFTHTPVDNLCFYLLSLSFIVVLGGSGRVIATSFFCLHLFHNRITGQLFWAWLILSVLAVTIEVLLTYDILHTLSHNDITPPYHRDFFFTNDSHGFYWLCHTLRYYIWIDLCLSGLSQLLVCWLYRLRVRQNEF